MAATFTFKWPHDGTEVYVTGSFDDWKQPEKLEKVGDVFEKTVTLSNVSEKIHYKFVVDGEWIADHAAPKETDASGIENNVLTPEDIVKSAPAEAAIISTVTPESSTAALAKDVPLEERRENGKKDEAAPELAAAVVNTAASESTTPALAKDVPLEDNKKEEEQKEDAAQDQAAAVVNTVSPESTTVALAKDVPLEENKKGEKTEDAPITAAIMSGVTPDSTTAALAKDVPLEKKEDNTTAALPGSFPETPAAELDKEVKLINPLPADNLAGNPVQLAPGEKIPESLLNQDLNANVKLDAGSYEKADALPGNLTAADLLSPVSNGHLIPESGLPILGTNDITINSVAPNSTTAALAAHVPLEPKAPAIVKESQEKAGVDPEASAIGEEVKEKAEVESELLRKVSEAPPTSESTAGKGTEKSENDKTIAETVTATATQLSEVVAAAAVAAKNTVVQQASDVVTQLPDPVKGALPISVQAAIAPAPAAEEKVLQEVAPEVPAEVKESIKEDEESPEPAANTVAVEEKALQEVSPEVPAEVKESIKEDEESPEPAANTVAVEEKALQEVSPEVPAEVKESIKEAEESPEPAAKTVAVEEKKAVERELLKEAKPTPAAEEASSSNRDAPDETMETKEAAKEPKPDAPKPATNGPADTTSATSTAAAIPSKEPGPSSSNAKATDSSSAATKKRHRLSAMLGKFKQSLSRSQK